VSSCESEPTIGTCPRTNVAATTAIVMASEHTSVVVGLMLVHPCPLGALDEAMTQPALSHFEIAKRAQPAPRTNQGSETRGGGGPHAFGTCSSMHRCTIATVDTHCCNAAPIDVSSTARSGGNRNQEADPTIDNIDISSKPGERGEGAWRRVWEEEREKRRLGDANNCCLSIH